MVRRRGAFGPTKRSGARRDAVDTQHCESVIRTVPSSSSRRGLLASLGSLVLATASLGLADDAAARKHMKHKKRKQQRSSATPRRRLQTLRFTNTTPIAVPGSGEQGPANPYPSTITVNGFANGVILDINVRLNGFSHSAPPDVDIVLAARHLPDRNAFIMSDVAAVPAGTSGPAVDLVLDDASPILFPINGPLASGTYQPTNVEDGGSDHDVFPAPAPAPSGNSALSVFSGQNPNGVWELWVLDDTDDDVGSFAGGWGLEITAEVDA